MPVNEITTKLGPARLKFRGSADSITEIAPKPGQTRFGFGSKWGEILLKNWDYG